MSEYEQAEQDVAAAKVAERIAEWKAMEAKAAYYRYASEAMAASAEVMGSRIRRDNALASEFVEKANAALEAPAQPLDELRSVPGAEEEVRDQLLTAFEDDHIVARAPLIDAQTCEEVDPRVSWKQDTVETDQPEIADVEETLPVDPLPGFDEADAESDALGDDPGDVDGEHISILNDPELQAAVDRANASIAQDEPRVEGDPALMFGNGMVADAERHQREPSLAERLTGMFKREKEEA